MRTDSRWSHMSQVGWLTALERAPRPRPVHLALSSLSSQAKRAEGKHVSFKITSAADIDIKSIPTRRQSQINWITRDHVPRRDLHRGADLI